MKKLALVAAIAATFTTMGANAAITAVAGMPTVGTYEANSYTLYLSGASAAEKFLEKLFTDTGVPATAKICDTSKAIYKYQDLVGTENYAYLCERAPLNTTLPTNKANVLIFKRSAGGSAFGVSPIVANANGQTSVASGASIEFLKINQPTGATGCTVATVANPVAVPPVLGVIKCAYDVTTPGSTSFQTHVPDFGVSDVDPGQFVGDNAPIKPNGSAYADVTAADVSKLTVKAAATLAFGAPVTKHLYFALQAAQMSTGAIPATYLVGTTATTCLGAEVEACMPSLSSRQLASIHAGNVADWNQIKVGTVGLYDWVNTNANLTIKAFAPAASAVHLCRRENGSGTQAQSNIHFLNDSCSINASPAAVDYTAIGITGEGQGYPMIHQMSASGDVDICLNSLEGGLTTNATVFPTTDWNATTTPSIRWAIGIQSLEKKTSVAGLYRFVKIDGVTPLLENVTNGKYYDWAENTFQYATTHVFSNPVSGATSADLLALTNAIITAAGEPSVMKALNAGFTHTFITDVTKLGAYLAVPTNYVPDANGAFVSTNPVNPYTHATSGLAVDNCRTPTVYNDGTSMNLQL
jgi:hypothetical protein